MGKLFKVTSEQTYKQIHRFILLETTVHLFDMKKYHLMATYKQDLVHLFCVSGSLIFTYPAKCQFENYCT